MEKTSHRNLGEAFGCKSKETCFKLSIILRLRLADASGLYVHNHVYKSVYAR